MDTIRIKWRAPILTLVIAATAIPVQLRPPGSEPLDFGIGWWDTISNVAGYVPVGIVLGELGVGRALLLAALISACSESIQFLSMFRTPSATDLVTNIIGAALGITISRHWRLFSPAFKVDRRTACLACMLTLALLAGMRAWSGPRPNLRGLNRPGGLEAHWKFDESSGPVALDSSGHELNAQFEQHPTRVTGVLGGAVTLDGKGDCINCGRSSALRLLGSMTISAWINSSSFPGDDAAIVSSLNNVGFQLDTTVDKGPRAIGFKLTDARGKLMARYGSTPLALGTWYHVAGVYSAEARTLDVYLNGQRDNGFLLGPVSPFQLASRETVFIGRRSVPKGFEFGGMIDDLRIYSTALTQQQIVQAMRGQDIQVPAAESLPEGVGRNSGSVTDVASRAGQGIVFCTPEDSRLPALAAVVGVLVAITCAGFWPSSRPLFWMVFSFGAGLLVLAATTSNFPAFNLWLLPLTSLAGGASVAVSAVGQS